METRIPPPPPNRNSNENVQLGKRDHINFQPIQQNQDVQENDMQTQKIEEKQFEEKIPDENFNSIFFCFYLMK